LIHFYKRRSFFSLEKGNEREATTMRFSPSRALYTGSLACLALLLYRIFKAPNQPCDLPAKHLERLALLVKEVHLVLESLRLTHALCFESLLGQVRVGRQLPWERGASVCIKEEEVLRFENCVRG